MLADDILALLKRKPMTSEELAKELRQPESLILTELHKYLKGLVQMETSGKWKRIPPESVK
jgi:predicted transcriptional regulator